MSQRQPCPVPLGWTVRVYRTTPTDEIARGIEICATHETGHCIHDYVRKERVPDSTPTLLRAGIPDVTLAASDITITSFLWERVTTEIGRWEQTRS